MLHYKGSMDLRQDMCLRKLCQDMCLRKAWPAWVLLFGQHAVGRVSRVRLGVFTHVCWLLASGSQTGIFLSDGRVRGLDAQRHDSSLVQDVHAACWCKQLAWVLLTLPGWRC